MIDIKNVEKLFKDNEMAFKENEAEILKTFEWFSRPDVVRNQMKNGDKTKYVLISLNNDGTCESGYRRYKNIGHAVSDFLIKSESNLRVILVSLASLLDRYESERVKKIKEFLLSSQFNSFSYCAAHFDFHNLESGRLGLLKIALVKLRSFYKIRDVIYGPKENCMALHNIDNLLLFIDNNDVSMTEEDIKNSISYLENENIKLAEEVIF